VLLAQHAALLFQRIADGSLLEPAVLGRWLVGLVLAGVMLAQRRAGLSLVHGRRAATFWVAVLVFHVAVAAAPAGSDPAGALALLPGTAASALLAVSALWLGPVAAAVTVPGVSRDRSGRVIGASTRGGFVPPFAARPPPLASA
jgi:hypothetical protein